jgi:cadmium resistance protein CadD (predicted permease)
VDLGLILQAASMFAVTNLDDLVVLALFFGQARGRTALERQVVVGQYLGFGAILVVSVVGALGTSLVAEGVLAHLGLVPLLLGARAAFRLFRARGAHDDLDVAGPDGPTVAQVALVTVANGGDNVGVYLPVFATAGPGDLTGYVTVFLVMVALWCALGRFVATRPPVARLLDRWGDVLLAAVLIGIGVVLLVDGGAFGW